MRNTQRAAIVALTIMVTGCVGVETRPANVDDALVLEETKRQQDLIRDTEIADRQRVWNTAYPIFVATRSLCEESDQRPRWGLLMQDRWMLPDESARQILERRYGRMDHATVIAVAKASPADKAGIQPGDQITEINGTSAPSSGIVSLNTRRAMEKVAAGDKPVNLAVTRNGQTHKVTMASEMGCNYYLWYLNNPAINATATTISIYAGSIMVTRGLLKFASDEDLAIILGHEIAHLLIDHTQKRMNLGLVGVLIDKLAENAGIPTFGIGERLAAGAMTRDYEIEADYLGLYITRRAGYDIQNAANLWRRIAIENPGSVKDTVGGTHPATPYRYLLLEATAKEIAEKEQRNEPLLPTAVTAVETP